jgi:hypothetical protein
MIILPPEIIIKILAFTNLDTIKNFRKINNNLIDNNINYIFLKLCKIYPFLKYNKNKVSSYQDLENTWNMEQYENKFENWIRYVKRFDTRQKNLIYDLLVNMVFDESILFHAVNNFDDNRIEKFKKLCIRNPTKKSYLYNYLGSIDY